MNKHLLSVLSLGISIGLSLLTGCSGGPKLPPDIAVAESDASYETIVILGTNDIHGELQPLLLKTREATGQEPVSYEKGGAIIFAAHVKELRREFGSRLLWLDAGDEFQGTLESNSQKGKPLVELFNSLGLNAAAIGNHEFDYGAESSENDLRGALKSRMSEAHYPYLAANIVETKTQTPPDFPNTRPHMIFKVGRIKVGVIGLSTLETPTTTRNDAVEDLTFTDMKEATLRESKALRQEGADVVVITAHSGLFCGPEKNASEHVFRKSTDLLGPCESSGEMVRLLDSLPEGTVDAVVSGHTHSVVHHWVDGVPVIQAGRGGQRYNLIYLTYDLKAGHLVREKSRIEGPIPVCPKVFERQQDCDGERPAPKKGRGDLVTPTLHGHEIIADAETASLLAPYFASVEKVKSKVVATAARPINHTRLTESELGDLVADAMRDAAHADVALMNAGGIRTSIESGPITYGALFRALPFENAISVLKVTGKELKTILRVAENGARGFFPVSGVKLRLVQAETEAKGTDLNGDGKIEAWEINRLLDARLSDGAPVKDGKYYKLATVDFLVQGGDDMKWAMSQVPPERIQLAGGGILRDAVEKYLVSSAQPINSADHPLLNPASPRFILVKGASSETTKRGHHRRRHPRP